MNTKKKICGALAAFLAAVALPISAMAAFSADVMGNPDYTWQENGISYAEKSLEEGGLQKLFYGEYNANSADAEYEWVIHSIRNGNKTTLSTVKDIAADYEQKTGKKVMLATNGDYFLSTGENVESYVNDGVVVSKGAFTTKHCIGFDNAGKVVVGRMTEVEKRLMVVLNGERTFFDIDKLNEAPGENEIAIYTKAGSHTFEGAGVYVCNATSGSLNSYPVYGSSYRLSPETPETVNLRSGQFAVVVKGEDNQFFYDNVTYGVEVDLVEIPAGEFAGCTWVLGGYDILVDDGVVNTKCHTDNSGDAKAPRTFIGFKEDGTGFLCIADGRQSGYALGISVNKEAELAKALGAQFALELDGGGSSTMLVRIDDVLTLRNKPSDGSMRRVSNAIMLVEKEKAEEQPEQPTPPATDPATPPATTVPVTAPATEPGTPEPLPEDSKAVVLIAVGAVVVIGAGVAVAVIGKKRKK